MRRFAAAYVAGLTALLVLTIIGGLVMYDDTGPADVVEAAADQHGYDFLTWEIQHFPRKWIYKARHLLDERSAAEEEAALQRYFVLVRELSGLQADPNAGERLKEAETERAGLEAEVEDIIEGRITGVLEDEGLAMEPPIFSELGLIFPPVDFELDAPPRVLVVSPRDHIELDRSFLLEPGLQRSEFEAVERKAESENGLDEGVSALVVGTGGVATYPAVISSSFAYEHLIDTAFHEWVHQYLVFYPLGRSYFAGGETRTLNETVASLAGHDLARLYFERYPGLEREAEPAPAPSAVPGPSPSPAFDFTAEMRALRRRVEDLLSQGQVAEAEALMNEKRDDFEGEGYVIRKLNQAYFAFHGSYGDSPGSIDPIGPKLQQLLDGSRSPGEFVRRVSGVTSQAELDRLLATLGG